MTTGSSGYRRAGGVTRIVTIIVVLWLIVGAIAAGQRGYYGSGKDNCASFATTVVTIVAGPLNYVGANPKVGCPKPSK